MQTGSVTAAARRLNVTQPAVSNALRHAEQQLGFRLFERSLGRLEPTMEAHELFPDVDEIFGRLATLNRLADGLAGGRAGKLAIAASPTFVNAYLPKAVSDFRRSSPEVQIAIHALPTARAIEDRVARREVDIGLVYAPVADQSLAVEDIGRSTIVCAVPRGSPLSRRTVLRIEDLPPSQIVATGPATRIGSALRDACAAHGLPAPDASIEVSSPQAACLMVAEGVGIGLVDLATVHQYALADVAFRPLRPRIDLTLCLISPRNRPRSRFAQGFANSLKSMHRTLNDPETHASAPGALEPNTGAQDA